MRGALGDRIGRWGVLGGVVAVAIAAGAALLLARGDDAEPPSEPSARTPTEQLRGFHYPGWLEDDDTTVLERLDTAREAAADVVRVPFVWPLYEPRAGEIDEEAIDRFEWFVDSAQERGLGVIWILGGSPCEYAEMPAALREQCLAAPDDDLEFRYLNWPPADENAWRASLRLVVDRVGDQLAAAEVLNEPNNEDFLQTIEGTPQARAEAYLRVLRWTNAELEDGAPELPVLAGSLAFADALFLQGLYEGGLAGLHDGIAIHPYSARPSQGTVATPPDAITFDGDRMYSFRSGIDAIHTVMDANGEGDLPIWITEFGSGACPHGEPLCAGSARRQAEWATDAFVVAGRDPNVAAVVMHELVDSDDLALGALRADGRPRPVLDSIRRADQRLEAGVHPGTKLMPGCLPAPFGTCVGQQPTPPDPIGMAPPELDHTYRVELACGSAQEAAVDRSGRRVETEAGFEFTMGCSTPWRPGGGTGDDGQQLVPAQGPAQGERTATFAFIAPGSRLTTSPTDGPAPDEGLPGEARVVAIEAGQALLRANTVDADVALRTNALAEGDRGTDLVLGCERGSYVGGSDWPGVPESVCTTAATLHMTAPGAPDLLTVPDDRDVREVVWEVSCPGPCDPEGGPFAARVVLERVVVTVAESEPPSIELAFPEPGTAQVSVTDLVGIDRTQVMLGDRRLGIRDSRSCEPSQGELLRTRVPCPRDGDRRVGFDVSLPAGAEGESLEVNAVDALGNEGGARAEVP